LRNNDGARIQRPNISHVIFDFDGTLSWLRHGWPGIMVNTFLAHAPSGWREDRERRDELLSEILSLNGKPTIHQCEAFAYRLKRSGAPAVEVGVLLAAYQEKLRAAIDERTKQITSGEAQAADFVVHGATHMIEALRARGTTLIILSGTVEHEVRAEAELLGVARFFDNHIYGSPRQGSFSKHEVIERLLREEGICGEHLLSFGDGPVEMEATKAVGGLAIGVASDEDENGSHRVDPFKREQLLRAGADIIIPDYGGADALLGMIFGE
jgi:phosphoglycolate phosphatase